MTGRRTVLFAEEEERAREEVRYDELARYRA